MGETVKGQAKDKLKEKRKETTRSLVCVLTQQEFNERAQDLTKKLDECSTLEAQMKSVAADFKARLAGAEAAAGRLNNIVRDKNEFRDVRCDEVWDYEAGEYSLIRRDTGEVVEHRPLRNDERHKQLTLAEADGGEAFAEAPFDPAEDKKNEME